MKKSVCTKELKRNCDDICALLKALCHPGRLLILGHLLQGPKTVSDLQEATSISQSQLSQFLTRMKMEKLVVSERKGRFQYYDVADERVEKLIRAISSICCV